MIPTCIQWCYSIMPACKPAVMLLGGISVKGYILGKAWEERYASARGSPTHAARHTSCCTKAGDEHVRHENSPCLTGDRCWSVADVKLWGEDYIQPIWRWSQAHVTCRSTQNLRSGNGGQPSVVDNSVSCSFTSLTHKEHVEFEAYQRIGQLVNKVNSSHWRLIGIVLGLVFDSYEFAYVTLLFRILPVTS